MIGVGIGLPFFKSFGAIDAQAQAHFNRVIADGGLVPSGLSGVNAFFNTVKTIYGTSDINTAISVGLDPQVLGYKLGAGSGTTLGQAAQKLYSPKDVFAGIGTGNAYWEGSGVAGNYVSTPNAAANQISGDIEIIAKIEGTFSTGQRIVRKRSTIVNYDFYISDATNTQLSIFFGASIGLATSSVGFTMIAGGLFVKATRTASNGNVIFSTSSDGITYTQLGTTQTTIAGNLITSTDILEIGSASVGTAANFSGKIYRATIATSLGGAPVVDFNPNQYTGANTWTSTTSEVWTVNRTGAGLADVVQTTAASQPLLLVHSGANYYWNSGVTGNVVYSNNSLSLTSQCDVKCKIGNITNTGRFASQDGANRNFDFFFSNNTTGILSMRCNTAFATQVNSSVGLGLTSAYSGWVRFTYLSNGTNADVKFYTSSDGTTWTQLGTTQTIISTGLSFGTCALGVGGNEAGGFNAILGYVYRVLISSTINGSAQRDFNPNQYNAATSQTQWTSSTGEVWTINTGTATSGYKGVLVDRSIVQGDGVDDTLITGTIASRQYFTSIISVKMATTANKTFIGSTLDSHLFYTASNLWRAYNGAEITGSAASTTLNMITIKFNNTSSSFVLNNNTPITGSTGTQSSTNVKIFGGESVFGNSIINTVIQLSSIIDSTQQTAMYNVLKSMSNNAF